MCHIKKGLFIGFFFSEAFVCFFCSCSFLAFVPVSAFAEEGDCVNDVSAQVDDLDVSDRPVVEDNYDNSSENQTTYDGPDQEIDDNFGVGNEDIDGDCDNGATDEGNTEGFEDQSNRKENSWRYTDGELTISDDNGDLGEDGIMMLSSSKGSPIARGLEFAIGGVSTIAKDFRSRIANLPLEVFSESMSNAVTPLHPLNVSANDVFLHLKDEYGIWVCLNGGDLADVVFRVGHIGRLTTKDNEKLVEAFIDLNKRGLL